MYERAPVIQCAIVFTAFHLAWVFCYVCIANDRNGCSRSPFCCHCNVQDWFHLSKTLKIVGKHVHFVWILISTKPIMSEMFMSLFMLFCFPCRTFVPKPLWASASWIGSPSAGHAEELQCAVRLRKPGHDQSSTGGPHHQPTRSQSRKSTRLFAASKWSLKSSYVFSRPHLTPQ